MTPGEDQSAVKAVRAELEGSFKGELLGAGDAGYDEARQIWNAMIEMSGADRPLRRPRRHRRGGQRGAARRHAALGARRRPRDRSIEPWLGRGVYVNMLNVDELDRVVEAYGGPEKYERMGAVKAKYDPTNLFRMNHNIKPAAAAGSA